METFGFACRRMRTLVAAAIAYGLVARLFEAALSARNARRVLARGGRRVEPDGFLALAAVHLGWFASMAVEELVLGPSLREPSVTWTMAAVFVASEVLRYTCMVTLGERWNVRVIVLDDTPRIRRGVYRFMNHPNYLAATVGVAALPLALGLPVTAAALLPLKLLAVTHRRRLEEAELTKLDQAHTSGSDDDHPSKSSP